MKGGYSLHIVYVKKLCINIALNITNWIADKSAIVYPDKNFSEESSSHIMFPLLFAGSDFNN